jgi:hypothetical protein
MLINEARWIRANLDQIDVQMLSPMLSIGSSTLEFRETIQPWINDYIFDPLRHRGVEVSHLDILPGEGVDIVGDITSQEVIDRIVRQRFRSVICTNLLEHVSDVHDVCSAIETIAPVCGYFIVTVPHRYPYHPDPIDVMFRPDIAQLLAFFPGSRCVNGALVDCGSFRGYVKHTLLVALPWGIRHSAGFDKRLLLHALGSFLASLFASWQVTCVLMKKEARSDDSTVR